MNRTDTSPEIDATFRRLMLARSPAERVRMACDMFDAARALAAASLPDSVASDLAASRLAMFERMYWAERTDSLVQSVIQRLRLDISKSGQPPGSCREPLRA